VSEQSGRYRVTFYCDQCARSSGYRRVLAVAEREPDWPEGYWYLRIARRLPRRLSPERVPSLKSHSGGAVPNLPQRFIVKPGRFQLVQLHAEATTARLICRGCTARPRVARAKLEELAEHAMAAGRHDAYA
jgi:hypothetical protein